MLAGASSASNVFGNTAHWQLNNGRSFRHRPYMLERAVNVVRLPLSAATLLRFSVDIL